MTEPESNPPELTPAQEDAVRRQLAAARHTDPMPGAVAERLDRVLAGLADERTPDPSVQPVVRPVTDLAARRRRRGVQLLVAAAAVVVAGVGISQLSGPGDNDSGGASSAGGRALDAESQQAPAEAAGPPSTNTAGPSSQPRNDTSALDRLPVIRPDHFRADVAEVADKVTPAEADTFTEAQAQALRTACPLAAKGGRTLAVSYDGDLAALVYRGPTDDGQRVDLYRCDPEGSSGFVRTVVIASP